MRSNSFQAFTLSNLTAVLCALTCIILSGFVADDQAGGSLFTAIFKASLVCLRRPVFYIATLGCQGDARPMVPYAFAWLLGRRAGSRHEQLLPWYGP